MSTEIFQVQNVKCGGCASAIQSGLGSIEGVSSVEVEVASGTVTVNGSALSRKSLSAKLSELGYPEA